MLPEAEFTDIAASPTMMYPACAMVEYASILLTLFCESASRFPNVMLMTAMTANSICQSWDVSPEPSS